MNSYCFTVLQCYLSYCESIVYLMSLDDDDDWTVDACSVKRYSMIETYNLIFFVLMVLDKYFINYFLLIHIIFCKKKMMLGEVFIHILCVCNVSSQEQHFCFCEVTSSTHKNGSYLATSYPLLTCSSVWCFTELFHIDCQSVALAATAANKLASKSWWSWRFRYAASNTIARHHWVGSTPLTGDLHSSLSPSVSMPLEHTLNHCTFMFIESKKRY